MVIGCRFSPKADSSLGSLRVGMTALDEKTHQLFIPAAKMQPPAAPGQRPTMEPGSFELVVVGK